MVLDEALAKDGARGRRRLRGRAIQELRHLGGVFGGARTDHRRRTSRPDRAARGILDKPIDRSSWCDRRSHCGNLIETVPMVPIEMDGRRHPKPTAAKKCLTMNPRSILPPTEP